VAETDERFGDRAAKAAQAYYQHDVAF